MKEDNKNKKKIVLIILGVILLIILTLLIGIKIGNSQNQNSGGVKLKVDKSSKSKIDEKKVGTVTRGVAIPGWETITLPANKTKVKVDFYNPESNKDLYYLTFKLSIIDKSGDTEVIYESELVEAGKHIYDIELNKKLAAGKYDGIIHVQPYRMSDKSQTNAADLKTSIIVK